MILNHSTIAQRLTEVVAICKQAALTAGETLFFANFNNKWSIAENLIHLVISVKGMNNAFQFPKEQLLAAFGKPDHASVEYEALFNRYQAALASNLVAPPAFAPQIKEGDTEASVLQLFDNQHFSLIENMKNFTDAELDLYQLPHPALGNLTIRELLSFTIFHIEHHTRTIAKIVDNVKVV